MEYNKYSEGVRCAIKELYTEIGEMIIQHEKKLNEIKKLNHKDTVLFSLFETGRFKKISIDLFNIPKDIDEQINNYHIIIEELKKLKEKLVKVTGYTNEDDDYSFQTIVN